MIGGSRVANGAPAISGKALSPTTMSNTPSLTFRRTSSGSPADTGDASAEAAERKAKLLQRRAKLMSEVQVLRVTVQREGQDASESEEKGEEGDGPSSPEGVVEVRRQKKRVSHPPLATFHLILHPTTADEVSSRHPHGLRRRRLRQPPDLRRELG